MEFVIGSKKGQLPVLFQATKYMERNFLFFVMHHVTILNELIQRLKEVFEFFQKLHLLIYARHLS